MFMSWEQNFGGYQTSDDFFHQRRQIFLEKEVCFEFIVL